MGPIACVSVRPNALIVICDINADLRFAALYLRSENFTNANLSVSLYCWFAKTR